MIDLVGWAATAVFCASYFFKPAALRRVQIVGAGLWLVYGILLGAPPVIVANVLVMLAAGVTAMRARRPVRLPE
jgi:hypothetical protein